MSSVSLRAPSVDDAQNRFHRHTVRETISSSDLPNLPKLQRKFPLSPFSMARHGLLQDRLQVVRFEVVTAVTIKNGVFFITVTRIGVLGTRLAVSSNWYFFAACVGC
jgi:hypothetical protein